MPQHEENPVDQAEQQVKKVLDGLVATGALQKSNCMSVEALLNMADESTLLNDSLDQEIFKPVMDAIVAHKNIEVVGGNDIGDDS